MGPLFPDLTSQCSLLALGLGGSGGPRANGNPGSTHTLQYILPLPKPQQQACRKVLSVLGVEFGLQRERGRGARAQECSGCRLGGACVCTLQAAYRCIGVDVTHMPVWPGHRASALTHNLNCPPSTYLEGSQVCLHGGRARCWRCPTGVSSSWNYFLVLPSLHLLAGPWEKTGSLGSFKVELLCCPQGVGTGSSLVSSTCPVPQVLESGSPIK